MRVAVALLCLIVIIVGTTADSTKDEKSGISRVMRGVRNGNSAKKKPQEKVGGKRTRKPRRKIKSKGRKVGSKRPGNRRGGKRGGKRSNKNPGRKAAAKKSTKKRGKVSKSKSVKKTNRGNQPRTSGTSRQALKGNDCDYIDLGAITTAGTGCATNGVKFVIKGNSGVRKQFLYVDGKVIIALTKLKFAECTAFTDITSQVNCKAVAGLDVVSLVGTNTPATPGATTSSSSSGTRGAIASLAYSFSSADLSPYCAGILVSGSWILTTASCLHVGTTPISASEILVILGDDIGKASTNPKFSVTSITIHPDFSAETGGSKGNIALIQLSTSADTTVYSTGSLPSQDSSSSGSANLVGWRISSYPGYLVETAGELTLTLQAAAACSESAATALCVGQQGACQGDFGAPLIQGNKVIGLVARNSGCSSSNYATFTKVSAYSSWVTTSIAAI